MLHALPRAVLRLTFLLTAAASSFGCQRTFADTAQQRCVEGALPSAPRETVRRAATLFRRACTDGDASACSALGVIEEHGLVGSPNPLLARHLYERACSDEDTRGCANFGRALLRGIGAPPDARRAVPLLERSCRLGDDAACATLGSAMLEGVHLARDERRGHQLLARACDRGGGAACLQLGDAVSTGATGGGAWARELWARACLLGVEPGCRRGAARAVLERPADDLRVARH